MHYAEQIHKLTEGLSSKEWASLHLTLLRYTQENEVNKILFLASCLEKLPGITCTDFMCFDYKTICRFSIDEWQTLSSTTGSVGKYHLTSFLLSHTSFSKSCFKKIGLDAAPSDEVPYIDKKTGIRVVPCNLMSPIQLATYQKVGFTTEDIISLRSFSLRPVFRVNFNELTGDGVLLSQLDSKQDINGKQVELFKGLEIVVRDENYEGGVRDDIIASGHVMPYNNPLLKHVKWYCKFDKKGIGYMSDFAKIPDLTS